MIKHKFKPGDICTTESNLGWEVPGDWLVSWSVDIDNTNVVFVLAQVKIKRQAWCYVLCGNSLCWLTASDLKQISSSQRKRVKK